MRRREFCLALAASPLLWACSGLRVGEPSKRGLYEGGAAGAVAIGYFHEFGEGLFLFDYASGRCGRLQPAGPDRFSLLDSFDDSGTAVAEVSFREGSVRYADRLYSPVPITRQGFRVADADVSLAGEIAMASGRAPHGAVVMVYGSGPAPKEAFDLWAFHFLDRGWAVVTYDKRGSGNSGGAWQTAGFEALTGDVAALIAHVRSQPPFAALPLGLWGASQAGWLLPQLCADGVVDFLIVHAGAVTTPAEQTLDLVAGELSAYGFPEDEIERARAYYALDIDVSRGTHPFSEIEAAHTEASAAGAEWLLGPPAPADAPERQMWRQIADFDPSPFWASCSEPVLAIFGGKDRVVPAERHAALLAAAAPGAAIVVLPGANHLGMLAGNGVRAEYPRRTQLHPDYFATIDRWLASSLPQRSPGAR